MKFDDLFEQRNLAGVKLKGLIKEKGYTKVSFAKVSDISRPTLDKLLKGEIDNKSTFNKHFYKILATLDIGVDELFFYEENNDDTAEARDYAMDEKAQWQYDLMMEVVGLCEIYY
jgi:transcriptional regulator with XRE-family HTH domain